MSEPFIGEIQAVGFNFAPRGWATCEGQLLPISQNTALFSLLGTTYGGDGRTTFGLPDLRGRSIVGQGRGAGLSPIQWGQRGGAEIHTLNTAELPSHNHTATLHGETAAADQVNPQNRKLAIASGGIKMYTDDVSTNNDRTMHSSSITVGNAGGNQSFGIRSPYLGMYVNIALVGIFPSRS